MILANVPVQLGLCRKEQLALGALEGRHPHLRLSCRSVDVRRGPLARGRGGAPWSAWCGSPRCAAAAGTPPCPLPTPPCVARRHPALGSARIPRPPGSLRSRHQSFTPPGFTPHASAAACCHAAVTHSKSRGDERMSMARKALRKIGEAVPRSRMPSTGREWPRLRPAGRGKRPQAGLGQTDGQGNDARPGRPEQRRPRPPARWVAGAPHLAPPPGDHARSVLAARFAPPRR